MSAQAELYSLLESVRRRCRLRRAVLRGSVGLVVGGGLLFLYAFLRFAGFPFDLTVALFACFTAPAVCFVSGVLQHVSLTDAAALVDRRLELRNRTSTALEFLPHTGALQQLQVADTLEVLQAMDARRVVSFVPDRQVAIGPAVVAVACLLCLLPPVKPPPVAEGRSLGAVIAVSGLDSQLEALRNLAEDVNDEELSDLAAQLQKDIRQTTRTEHELKDVLTRVSEAQQKLQKLASQMDIEAMDAQLADVGEALSSAESFQSAADALKNQDHEKAADALADVDPELDETETRPTSEQLERTAQAAKEKGMDELGSDLDELSNAVAKGDQEQIKKAAQQLGDRVKMHGTARKVSQQLKSQIDALGDARNLAAHSNSEGNGASADATGLNQKKGESKKQSHGSSKKAGSKTAGNIHGEKSRLEGQLQMARLTGKMTEAGESETETVLSTESSAKAKRLANETFARYRRLSEAALQAEALPPGQRMTIKRYFERIRPEMSSSEE